MSPIRPVSTVLSLTALSAALCYAGLAQAAATGQAEANPFASPRSSGVSHQSNVSTGDGVPVRSAAPAAQGAQTSTSGTAKGATQVAPSPAPGARPTGNTATVSPLPSPKIAQPNYTQEVLNRMAPADGAQLREILKELYERQGAALTPENPGVTCKATQYTVDLSPGAAPPVIRVAKGLGATVDFVDSAGNPWPITFANNFYAQADTVTQMAPHVLSVASNSPHLSGSVGVMLKGLSTPINFVVTPAQEEADCRVDLHVPGLAPGATAAPGALDARPGLAKGNLTGFLYGGTPKGATRLKVQADGGLKDTTRAWQENGNGHLILRTNAQVESPGWYQRLPALDGTAVYELPPASHIRVALDGNPSVIVVQGLVPTGSGGSSDEGMSVK